MMGEVRLSVLPDDPDAYWKPGRMRVAWNRLAASGDDIDLGRAFRRPDVPGLDGAEPGYVVGYAFATVTAETAARIRLVVERYKGTKMFLNGKPVIDDHDHTMNRDPNSAVLPLSAMKPPRGRGGTVRRGQRAAGQGGRGFRPVVVSLAMGKP